MFISFAICIQFHKRSESKINEEEKKETIGSN